MDSTKSSFDQNVRQCTATGNAIQANIIAPHHTNNTTTNNTIVHNHLYIHAKEVVQRLPGFGKWLSRQQEDPEALPDFLQSIISPTTPSRPVATNGDNVPFTNGAATADNHSTKSHGHQSLNENSHREILKDEPWFKYDLSLCIAQYPSTVSSLRVLEVLEPEEYDMINAWCSSSEQGVLFISRSDSDESESDWTTDLTMEIMNEIIDQNGDISQYRPVVTHFCKQNASSKNWRCGFDVVHDFIAQLQDHQPSERREHLSGISQDILENPAKLWGTFEQRVILSQAKAVFIFLDNIDWMFNKLGFDDFKEFLARLWKARQNLEESHGVTIRVLVTCSTYTQAIETYFEDKGIPRLALDHPTSDRDGSS